MCYKNMHTLLGCVKYISSVILCSHYPKIFYTTKILTLQYPYMRIFCLCFDYISSCDHLLHESKVAYWNSNYGLSANIPYLNEAKCAGRHLTNWSSFFPPHLAYKQHHNITMKHCYKEIRDKTFTRELKGTDWYYAMQQIKMPWHMGHNRHQSSDLYQAGKNCLWVLKESFVYSKYNRWNLLPIKKN